MTSRSLPPGCAIISKRYTESLCGAAAPPRPIGLFRVLTSICFPLFRAKDNFPSAYSFPYTGRLPSGRGDRYALDYLCDSDHPLAVGLEFPYCRQLNPHSAGDCDCGCGDQSDHGPPNGLAGQNGGAQRSRNALVGLRAAINLFCRVFPLSCRNGGARGERRVRPRVKGRHSLRLGNVGTCRRL